MAWRVLLGGVRKPMFYFSYCWLNLNRDYGEPAYVALVYRSFEVFNKPVKKPANSVCKIIQFLKFFRCEVATIEGTIELSSDFAAEPFEYARKIINAFLKPRSKPPAMLSIVEPDERWICRIREQSLSNRCILFIFPILSHKLLANFHDSIPSKH